MKMKMELCINLKYKKRSKKRKKKNNNNNKSSNKKCLCNVKAL